MRYIFEGGVEEEMRLTFMEHKLCVRHSGGPYPPTHLFNAGKPGLLLSLGISGSIPLEEENTESLSHTFF